jgi:hypothetical protein
VYRANGTCTGLQRANFGSDHCLVRSKTILAWKYAMDSNEINENEQNAGEENEFGVEMFQDDIVTCCRKPEY